MRLELQNPDENITLEAKHREHQQCCPHTYFKCPNCGKYKDNLHHELHLENVRLKIVVALQQKLIDQLCIRLD